MINTVYHFHSSITKLFTKPNNHDSKPPKPLQGVMLMSCLLIVLMPLTAKAEAINPSVVNSLSEVQNGSLLIPSDDADHYLRAPLLDTAVKINVQGMLTRTTVEQSFSNNTNEWIEAIYVFPLPDNASVDELAMVIDGRRIIGKIQQKEKARKKYEEAKRAGKKASLLDQQRANLFTTRVANIPPGESIQISIAYQSSIRYTDGQFELYFPLTITPRYIPGTAKTYNSEALASHVANQGHNGWAIPTDQVPDANLITPPMTNNSSNTSKVSINVTLDTGLDLASIKSNSHDILKTQSNNTQDNTPLIWGITLSDTKVPADRDFKLSWAPQPQQAPVAAIFRQDTSYPNTETLHSFASLMLMPPQEIYNGSMAREVIFVMDTSSSMSGNSIIQARKALKRGIERLSDNDIFNVLEFNSQTQKLYPQAVEANDANKSNAINWVASLVAHNGTEIMGAMQAALNHSDTNDTNTRIRQIVFVTDGSVGNEDEIFRYLERNIGNSRLFTVGLGSAPNTWFMRKAAELGRGTYTTIANSSELIAKTSSLFTKLERPVLTNINLEFNTATAPEVFPTTIPDVYMGEPVLADARWSTILEQGDVIISGQYAGAKWTQKLRLAALSTADSQQNGHSNQLSTQGLDKLWAHRKIQSLEDQLLFGADASKTENEITQVALDYSLVTRYTSLLAVEESISRDPTSAPLASKTVPQTMPHGNTMLFPQGSLGTNLRFAIAFLFSLLSVLFALATLRQATEFKQHQHTAL